MRRRLKVVISLVIAIAILLSSYFVVFNPSTGVASNLKLTEVDSGYTTWVYNNTTQVSPWVNLSIKFFLPLGLDPARLSFLVNAPNGELPFHWLLFNQSVGEVNVTYRSYEVPHWLARTGLNGADTSSMVFGNITNPDGNLVGGYSVNSPLGGFTWINGDSVVQSGGIIHLVFESTISSLQGFAVTAQNSGAQGSSSVTLVQS